jgi:hypothetical protein
MAAARDPNCVPDYTPQADEMSERLNRSLTYARFYQREIEPTAKLAGGDSHCVAILAARQCPRVLRPLAPSCSRRENRK